MLLPVPYFMLTFTLPAALCEVVRSNQNLLYRLLFRISAAATQHLAKDPRFVGGQIGLVGSCTPGDATWPIIPAFTTLFRQVARQ
ncbi:MAG: hypothetical protein WAV05_16195 [Anaerolineales bacterium]